MRESGVLRCFSARAAQAITDDVVVSCSIDESVSLESMKQVTKTLALFIAEWCGLEPKH